MDTKLTRRGKLYAVTAIYKYDDGKQHYPAEKTKTYPAARYVLNFIKDEVKKARRLRERMERLNSMHGSTGYRDNAYTVTFKVYETPLEWEDKTEDWEDELVLMALGGET